MLPAAQLVHGVSILVYNPNKNIYRRFTPGQATWATFKAKTEIQLFRETFTQIFGALNWCLHAIQAAISAFLHKFLKQMIH